MLLTASPIIAANRGTRSTGERPHKCPFCDETFKDPARQYRHKKDVHKYVTTRERKMMSEIYKTSRRGASSSDIAGTDDELA